MLENSDDSDGLVKNTRRGRSVRKEVFASGGLANKDELDAHVHPGKQKRMASKVPRRTAAELEVERKIATRRHLVAAKPTQKSPLLSPTVSAWTEQSTTKSNISPLSPRLASAVPQVNGPTTKAQETPVVEKSFLGLIRPRQRQPSMLQRLQQDETTLTNDEENTRLAIDNDDFSIPLDESTPQQLTVRASPQKAFQDGALLSSTSRKRKTNEMTGTDGHASIEEPPAHEPTPTLASILPAQSSPQTRQQAQRTADNGDLADDEIMAPPLSSSSPVSSPQKPKAASPIKSQRRVKGPLAPSTKQLQALMPARRKTRQKIRSDFDIPEDSDISSGLPDEGDESFTNSRKGKSKSKAVVRGRRERSASTNPATVKAKARQKGQTQRQRTSTLSPTKTLPNEVVTPLRQPTAKAKQTSALRRPTTKAANDLRRRSTYSRRSDLIAEEEAIEAGSEKENQPSNSSGNSGEQGSSSYDHTTTISPRKKLSQEQERLKAEFAAIDDFQMEFEDVTVDDFGSGSSQDMMRR